MTRTEERLRDALQASAGRVKDDRLRPLPATGRRTRRVRGWLIPAAAAASVVLVIAVAVALVGGPRPGADNGGTGITAAEVPEYLAFVSTTTTHFQDLSQLVVIATATGAVVARAPMPDNAPAVPAGIAAAPDDRTFYALFRVGVQTRIYTLSIPARGTRATMTLIKGGVLSNTSGPGYPVNLDEDQLAVSPNGTELALTTGTARPATQMPDQIVVVNLRTGAHRVWQGGLDRPGRAFGVVNLSWADGGKSLVFLAQWCDLYGTMFEGIDQDAYCSGANTPDGYRDAQVWSLNATTDGGSLNDGRLLLRQSAAYPTIAQAIAGPGGTGLTVLVLPGPISVSEYAPAGWHDLVIDRISADGSLAGTQYRAAHSATAFTLPNMTLNWDPSGRYLILVNGLHPLYAWVGDGTLHSSPVPGPYSG